MTIEQYMDALHAGCDWYQYTAMVAVGRHQIEVCVSEQTATVSSAHRERAFHKALRAMRSLQSENPTRPNDAIDPRRV